MNFLVVVAVAALFSVVLAEHELTTKDKAEHFVQLVCDPKNEEAATGILTCINENTNEQMKKIGEDCCPNSGHSTLEKVREFYCNTDVAEIAKCIECAENEGEKQLPKEEIEQAHKKIEECIANLSKQ